MLIEELLLNEILRGPRTRVGGDFDRTRMINVLRGIQLDQALPPVVVTVIPDAFPFKYRLAEGFHRFHASIAVGYTRIPAIVVDRV